MRSSTTLLTASIVGCSGPTITFTNGVQLKCPFGTELASRDPAIANIREPGTRLLGCVDDGTLVGKRYLVIPRGDQHALIATIEPTGVRGYRATYYQYPASLAPGENELHETLALCGGRFIRWEDRGVEWTFAMPCPARHAPMRECASGYVMDGSAKERGLTCAPTRQEELARRNRRSYEAPSGPASALSWPVPNRGINTGFHDPNHPYAHLYDHEGVDLEADQGDQVRAAGPGRVTRAKDAGYGYNWVRIDHSGGLATVYGHLSRIDVSEGAIVHRGRIIGAVGGTPGTPGAGRKTTGPHLHFETRVHDVAVDPMRYLAVGSPPPVPPAPRIRHATHRSRRRP